MMQLANETEFKFTAEIIDIKNKMSEREQVITVENKSETETKTCFRTDARYFCKNTQCDCRTECKKLVAAWMR